ncbi:E3 ubiquitin-protein ligase TRIM33-like [Acanthaster planci]|uniref:E3 ubiquitin-protein ligase TRIM33-like n=1 Tax=Acanthaster planci TaxID=133434 RepID=A0A8B7Y2L6_ACAPL|nr:E3 ubiquitin-protein ligase TRIM33-like [Acanthaster planci]
MATGGTAEVLGKIGERHLECSICFNRFTEPKLLNCIHSFCMHCLKNLRDIQDTGQVKIKCPLCRRYTELGRSGVEDLPTIITLSALVEEFAIQEQLLQGQGSEIKCQSCEEKNQASLFCTQCAQFLCQDCQKVHGRLAGTKFHKTYTMAQLQSGEIAYKSKLREEPTCNKHPDQNLNIYCNTCQQLICTTCSVLKHQKHSCADITEAFDKCKQEIEGLMAKAEKKKKELNKAKEDTAESRKKLDTMFEATNKKISQKADKKVAKEVASIREMEQKLKQETKEIYQDRVKTMETVEDIIDTELTVAKQELDEMNKLLAEEIKTEILHLKQKFMHSLRELTEQQPQRVPEKLHFIDFQEYSETEKSLGRLILKDEWRLDREMVLPTKHGITSITVFSNNEIATVDIERNPDFPKRLVIYSPTSNPESPFISQMLQIPDITDPCQVAVNRLDHLIVLDGLAVKTFSREYQLLHQFQPGIDSESKPTCLAVDEDNLIAVGHKYEEQISLCNPDGTLIRKLSAPMIEDQLTVSNKQLMYINNTESKLISKDYEGETVLCVETDTPRTVCCDIYGNIYVAKGKYTPPEMSGSGAIYRFDTEDKIMKCVKKKCTLCPVGMVFTPTGDLVVGGRGPLQIYHRI